MLDDKGYDEPEVLRALKDWWNDQVSQDDPFAEPKQPAGTIYDVLPAIDSLGVVSALVAMEKHVPFKVPIHVIRPGGYASYEDLTSDLMPKLSNLAERHKAQAQRAQGPAQAKKEKA